MKTKYHKLVDLVDKLEGHFHYMNLCNIDPNMEVSLNDIIENIEKLGVELDLDFNEDKWFCEYYVSGIYTKNKNKMIKEWFKNQSKFDQLLYKKHNIGV